MPETAEFAGTLNRYVVIEQATETQNARGEAVPTWSTFATVFASIEPLSGRELFTAQQRVADVTHVVRLPYQPGVLPKMRLNYNGRLFNILTVLNLQEANRKLELLAREIV